MDEWMSEWFYYDPSSPSGLRWKKNRYSGQHYKILVASKDSIAGRKTYRRGGIPWTWEVTFKNKKYRGHRIIWNLVNGNIADGLVIDHLDRNPFNNNIENLSLKTNKQNQQNRNKSRNNKTGVTGVSLKEYSGTFYFIASYKGIDGRYIRKSFSIKKYGDKKAFELACKARLEGIQLLREAGELYTDTHGE